MQNSTTNVRKLTGTAMLGAVAAVLMYLEFPIPIMPSFVKLDVSELPALLAAYAYGPLSGIAVCLIKNLIKLPSTSTAAVGELFNFVMGALFVGVAGFVYKRSKTRRSALIGAGMGALVMAVVSVPYNYFIVYPAYVVMYHLPLEAIIGMYQAINPSVDGLLACLLHADAGFAPKLFPAAALHLSLLAGGVLGPKAVAVAHKFPVQLLQFVRLLSGKPAVNGPGGGHGPVFAQCLVGFLPQPAHRTGQGWHLQGINRLLHGNIAGQPPQAGVPASAQPGVAEHAVQNAVQYRAGQIAPVAAVQPNEPFRVIAQSRAVRGKVVQPRGRGGHQRTQGRVHVAQVQVQLTADAVHGAFGHGGNPFFLSQNMLGGH